MKELQQLIYEKKKIYSSKQSIYRYIQMYRINKKIDNCIKEKAQEAAIKLYDEMIELLYNLVNINF